MLPDRRARCEACGTDRSHGFVWRHSGYDLWRCRSCGLLAVLDLPPPQTLGTIYRRSYFEETAYIDYAGHRAVLERNFRRYVRIIRRYVPRGRLLEVGSAYGYFLGVAREHFDVTGVEISPEAADEARSTVGVRVHTGDVLMLPLDAAGYDAAVLWDTIEHMPEPSKALERLGKLLRPGGYLFLTTPDSGSLAARLRGPRWRLIYPPEHLYYFTQGSLRRLLRRVGFCDVAYEHRGLWRGTRFAAGRSAQLPGAEARWLARAFAGIGRVATRVYLNLADILFVRARRV